MTLALVAIGCISAGCGKSQVPQERVIQIRQASPVEEVRSYLEGYAQGQPVGSERELFPQFVDAVRKVDANLAGTVETRLAEIQANPSQAASLAKKLLARLGPTREP